MTEQLSEAAMLLGVGMAVVFAFLSLLIAGIHLIAWFARAFPDAPVNQQNHYNNNKKNPSPTTAVNADIVAAIGAAIHTHRNKQ